jgi:hypothetical protein
MEDVESLSASALAIPLPQPAISVVMNGFSGVRENTGCHQRAPFLRLGRS